MKVRLNKTADKPEVFADFNNYFYKTEVHKSIYRGRTNDINYQIKIPDKIDFIFPVGELKLKESAVAEPFEIVDFQPPVEFNLRFIKDANKIFL